MWVMNNLDNNKLGITSLQSNADKKPIFGCIIINTKDACYFEAEGFSLSEMFEHGVIKVVQPKDILSEMLS